MLRSLYLALLLVGCGSHAPPPTRQAAAPEVAPLWMQVAGDGEPTVVFEAGGGDDSSVWASLEPEVRLRVGVRTVVYDRAGLGKSPPAPGPYQIDHEVDALEHALARFSIKGPIVLVAHSYGGFVAELMAARDKRVVGAVLVDANLPAFFDDAELARLQAKYLPQLPALEKARPALAQVMGAILRAYPDTVKRVKAAPFPPAIPVVDIVAEHSWGDSDAENAAMKQAHDAFVAAAPAAREAVFATGSGHYVMRDQPELVIHAIGRVVQRVRTGH
ncbi:MAG TPA: alpha/beta fold hydrolase [Kofleriaceae bacterium]|nr:alpha/beta fold hydrolase [Kofleriaceae bacterium]